MMHKNHPSHMLIIFIIFIPGLEKALSVVTAVLLDQNRLTLVAASWAELVLVPALETGELLTPVSGRERLEQQWLPMLPATDIFYYRWDQSGPEPRFRLFWELFTAWFNHLVQTKIERVEYSFYRSKTLVHSTSACVYLVNPSLHNCYSPQWRITNTLVSDNITIPHQQHVQLLPGKINKWSQATIIISSPLWHSIPLENQYSELATTETSKLLKTVRMGGQTWLLRFSKNQ